MLPSTYMSLVWKRSLISWTTYSNHGSFYFNQLAALQVLVSNSTGALATVTDYFNGIYMNQIVANGDQVGSTL